MSDRSFPRGEGEEACRKLWRFAGRR